MSSFNWENLFTLSNTIYLRVLKLTLLRVVAVPNSPLIS